MTSSTGSPPGAHRRGRLHRVRGHPRRDDRPADRAPRPDLNKSHVDGQGELFTVWRRHAAFTDSPFILVQARAQHRGHAIIEQVFAELIDGPLAHLPSGRFTANAWLACIAIAHNLTRAAGILAGRRHATARAASIRRHLINVAGGSPTTPEPSPTTYPSTGRGTNGHGCSTSRAPPA